MKTRTLYRNLVIFFINLIVARELMAQSSIQRLSEFSLEDLTNIRVTSVSRRQQELLNTASAVYVITQEDIRRSGATDIADVLRMVPGVNVGQISSSKWAVSARGFNAQWENKLLVMVDGRSVYAPSFSGVFWDLQDFVLDDIERIEVIRGPGATMWGANAVNGVISITTKHAADTQGGLISVDGGERKLGDTSVQYGGAIGKNAFYRIFGTQKTRSALPEASTGDLNDSWNLTHGGFRLDWQKTKRDDFTVDGDLMRAVAGARVKGVVSIDPIEYRGPEHSGQRAGSIRTRWNHSIGDASKLTFQFYFEDIDNYETFTTMEHLYDLDMQHQFKVGKRHEIIWGLGQRWASDRNINSAHMGYSPAAAMSTLSSAFLQDEIAVAPDRFFVTLGTKLERNTYTGFEVQPTVRAVWRPDEKRSVWAAVSRAVRTANRSDRGFYTDIAAWPDGDSATVLSLMGHSGSRSEDLTAYELGHRYQATRRLSFDVASFYNVYDHLATTEPGDPFQENASGPTHWVLPIYFANQMKGETYGAESAVSYQVNSSLTLKGGYSLLRMQLHPYPTSQDSYSELAEKNSPTHQAYVGTSFTLPKGLQLSANSYFVGGLAAWNVPAQKRVDLNLSWHATEDVEFSVNGQNLLNPSKPEFGENEGTAASAMKRSVFGKIKWTF